MCCQTIECPTALELWDLKKNSLELWRYTWNLQFNILFYNKKVLKYSGGGTLVTVNHPDYPWSDQHCISLKNYIDSRQTNRPTTRSNSDIQLPVTPGVERLRTGACGVVVVVVSGGVTGSEMGRGIC
jgi:hypothetical protein